MNSVARTRVSRPALGRPRIWRRWAGRRPVLFLLVYASCLMLVVVTASAQGAVITRNFQDATVQAIVDNDAALIRAVVNTPVTATDISLASSVPARAASLQATLVALATRGSIERIELRATDGRVVASNVALAPDADARPEPGLVSAFAGTASATLVEAASAGATGPALGVDPVLREDLPLTAADGTVTDVLTLWRDAQPIVEAVQRARQEVVVLTITAAVILAGVLYFVFRAAQDRIRRQTDALVEATRRDVVTGLLNHGALVDQLAEAMERSRAERGTVTIALVDIDNFRLLNETNGHGTGDEALLAVAGSLRAHAPEGAVLGRYGPDEFLLVATGTSVADMESALESVRAGLSQTDLQQATERRPDPSPDAADQGGGERLPVTISAGICASPADSDNVTDLLAVAARTLGLAKASGGDAVRRVRADEAEADARGFDVLKGLVVAIDTKDRYTKRHSEDVARYALFIADRLGLDAEMHRVLRLSGLLHDVGKIGIPDQILRKPGKLTEAEYGVVKQHVALGDLIVRDLPDVEAIRAGIRHHHERWDGKGYLHGLVGDDIPLTARILAVGDAFSAMTTTRPYRKALAIREAIRRLEDAAGSQLDEAVVRAFVDGLETAADPPLPGSTARILWTPSTGDDVATRAAA